MSSLNEAGDVVHFTLARLKVANVHAALLKFSELLQKSLIGIYAISSVLYKFECILIGNLEALHNVHDYTRSRSRSPHGTVNEDYVSVFRLTIELINC